MSDEISNQVVGDEPRREFGWLSLRRKSDQRTRRTISKPVYTIGRELGNDLVLPDPAISRHHARILCTVEGCRIEDLGSQNGTFLNEERLVAHEARPLIPGDVVRIGEYTLVFNAPEPKAELTPAADDGEFVLTFTEAATVPELPRMPLAWPLPPRSSYLQNLPSFFAHDSLLDRFLLIFESILAPIEQIVDHIPMLLDARTMPADMLPWVASWLDLTLNEKWPESRRRDLIRAASALYRWRGTRNGLCRYLEIYAGVTPEIDEHLDAPHTFRVTLRVPDDQPVDETLVREIIESEKPAHTAYELVIDWDHTRRDA